MAVKIDPSVLRAINRQVNRDTEFQRYARENYGMSAKKLLAKVTAGEFGGRSTRTGRSVVSSAGARGPFQFIPSTRSAYIEQYGVDPWKNDDQAARAAIIHIKGTGLAGYNPGMPSYTNYILGQKIDPDSLNYLRGRRSGRQKSNGAANKRGANATSVLGVDNSALRQSLLQGYLQQRHDPNALLSLAQGLEGAQDIPGVSLPSGGKRQHRATGRDVVTATGQSVNKMLSKAVRWDKAKAPYLWGGGHGAIAKPGQPVDCSGFVSAVLGLDTPQVSGNLASWGKPGAGRWISVYANDGHVLMSIRDPRTKKVRWFGTSRSNPGGGAGEISPPSASYLASFQARHPG